MVETQFIHDENLNEDIVPTGKHGDNYEAKRAKIEEYIWLIFKNVKDLGDDAKQILRGMALLPSATPYDRNFLKKHLTMFDAKEITINLSLLTEHGWLEKEQNKWFKMHPLISDVVVINLEVDITFAENYIWQIAKLILYDNVNPNDSLFEKQQYEVLAEHIVILFLEARSEALSRLLQYMSWYNQHFGNYNKSVKYGEQALDIAKYIFGMDGNIIPAYQNTLALAYRYVGRFYEAANLLEQALVLYKNNDENNLIARYQANLGWVYKELGNYKEAIKLYRFALDSDNKKFGSDHPRIAIRLSHLAMVYMDIGNFKEAAVLLEKALASDEKNFGKDHPNVTNDLSLLGQAYKNLGQLTDSINCLERALKTDLKNFGHEHPNVGNNQDHLACIYFEIGQTEKAKMLWEKAYINFLTNAEVGHSRTIAIKKYLEKYSSL